MDLEERTSVYLQMKQNKFPERFRGHCQRMLRELAQKRKGICLKFKTYDAAWKSYSTQPWADVIPHTNTASPDSLTDCKFQEEEWDPNNKQQNQIGHKVGTCRENMVWKPATDIFWAILFSADILQLIKNDKHI